MQILCQGLRRCPHGSQLCAGGSCHPSFTCRLQGGGAAHTALLLPGRSWNPPALLHLLRRKGRWFTNTQSTEPLCLCRPAQWLSQLTGMFEHTQTHLGRPLSISTDVLLSPPPTSTPKLDWASRRQKQSPASPSLPTQSPPWPPAQMSLDGSYLALQHLDLWESDVYSA